MKTKHYTEEEENKIITTNWNRMAELSGNDLRGMEREEFFMRIDFQNAYSGTKEHSNEADNLLRIIERTIQGIRIDGKKKGSTAKKAEESKCL